MAFQLKSRDDLFPTPLFRFEIGDSDTLNQAILREIAERRAAEEGVTKSNRKGWHSTSDLFRRKEPAQAALAKMLLGMIVEATRQAAPDADLSDLELVPDGWINVNPRGGYNSPHDHPGAFWSGSYYVQVPDDERSSGRIEFLSPHKPLPGLGLIKGPVTVDKVTLRPKPGSVLIFPASLIHWVHPNESDEDRVTIAFNARFRSKRKTSPGEAS